MMIRDSGLLFWATLLNS